MQQMCFLPMLHAQSSSEQPVLLTKLLQLLTRLFQSMKKMPSGLKQRPPSGQTQHMLTTMLQDLTTHHYHAPRMCLTCSTEALKGTSMVLVLSPLHIRPTSTFSPICLSRVLMITRGWFCTLSDRTNVAFSCFNFAFMCKELRSRFRIYFI